MLLVGTRAEYLIYIVHVVPSVRGVAVGHGGNVLLRIVGCVFAAILDGPACQLVHHLRHVVVVCVLRAIHEFREIGIHGDTVGGIVSHLGLAGLTALGSDDDDTTGTCQTVNGSRGTVLQYRYALDVVRIQVVDIAHGETVHDIRYAVYRTTNLQRSLVQARFTGFLQGRDTRQAATEQLRYVGGGGFQQFVTLHGRYGTGQ